MFIVVSYCCIMVIVTHVYIILSYCYIMIIITYVYIILSFCHYRVLYAYQLSPRKDYQYRYKRLTNIGRVLLHYCHITMLSLSYDVIIALLRYYHVIIVVWCNYIALLSYYHVIIVVWCNFRIRVSLLYVIA